LPLLKKQGGPRFELKTGDGILPDLRPKRPYSVRLPSEVVGEIEGVLAAKKKSGKK